MVDAGNLKLEVKFWENNSPSQSPSLNLREGEVYNYIL